MRVTIKCKETSAGNRWPRKLVVEILPRRISVDFNRDSATRGRGEDVIPVRPNTSARTRNAAAWVRQNSHIRLVECHEHPTRLISVLAKNRVRRRQHDVECPTLCRGQVKPAGRIDVRFYSLQQSKSIIEGPIDISNSATLLFGLGHRHAARDAKAVGMIGYGRVHIPSPYTRVSELMDARVPIAPLGMHLKVAAVVADRRTLQAWICKNPEDLGTAEKGMAQFAPLFDLRLRSLWATASSTVGESPASSTSRITRIDAGPIPEIFGKEPLEAIRSVTGTSSARIAAPARL